MLDYEGIKLDKMDEFINIIKQLRDEGVIKWLVILRPFSDEITFIFTST